MLQMTPSLPFIEALVTAITVSNKTAVTYVARIRAWYRVRVRVEISQKTLVRVHEYNFFS